MAEDNVLWEYHCPQDKSRLLPCGDLMDNVRAWNENDENHENDACGSFVGANLAVRLWIFSAVENNWAPVYGEDNKKKLIQLLNKICNRVEEEHVWVSEQLLAVHEQ